MATSGPVFAGAVAVLAGGTGTWASTPNVVGGDDNTVAVWTKPAATNQTSPALELSSFGGFADIPAGSTINSVTVAVNQYNANTTRMQGGTFELWNAAVAQIGVTQNGLNTTTTTNLDSFAFTGVTLAQLATLRVRVRARGAAANAQTSNGSVDYVSLTVDYTTPALAETISLAAEAFAATATTAGATFAQADLATLAVSAQAASAVVVPPALPGVATLTATALDATALIVVAAYDRVYHVHPGGSDAGAGTMGQPLATISEAVTRGVADNAADRSVLIQAHPGTYREQVTIPAGATSQPFTLEGYGAVVSASDLSPAGDWTVHDAGNRIYRRAWTQGWGTQAWPDGWSTAPNFGSWTDVIRRRELVVIDGVWIRQVLAEADLTTYDAAYYVDDTTSRLYVRLPTGTTIGGVTIEVGMRSQTLDCRDRANLTIRGLTFQHAATEMQNASARIAGCDNFLIEDCTVRLNGVGGLQFGQSAYNTGPRMVRVATSDNGVWGFGGYFVQNMVATDCSNDRNNTYRGAWANFKDWEDGFKVLYSRNCTFRRCKARGNNSNGIWFDNDNSGVLLEDCTAVGNTSSGLLIEFSQGPFVVRRGIFAGNFRGFSTTGARQVTLEDCLLVGNNIEVGIGSEAPPRTVVPWDGAPPFTVNPEGWTWTGTTFWTTAAGDQLFNSLFLLPDDQWATFKASFAAANNTYRSPAASPFRVRTSTGSQQATDFTGWKANLGGTLDSTSTFAATAPTSPAPLPPADSVQAAALALPVAPFVRPGTLTATPINDDRIDLSWTPIPAASGYDLERNGVIVAFELVPTVYSDTGLDPATLYTYRVRASRPGTG